MSATTRTGGRWLCAALLFGVAFVAFYDAALAPVRYPYAADSASYIEMADSLYHEGRPRVTPWDLEFPHDDRIAQRLFPPGFPLLVAAFIPLAGDATRASLWPGRLAAALLPALLFAAFRGALGEAALALVACFALATPGVRGWQYLAYSDVTALAVAVLAVGALARGLGLVGTARAPRAGWLLAAGLLAGASYGIRNAGLAVLAAALLVLAHDAWRARRGAAAFGWWLAGAAMPLAALWAYNLATFGQLQPYTMPASQRAWQQNVGDYALAQLTDLGLPWQFAEATPPALAVGALALLAAGLGTAWWRLRADARRQGLLTLLAGYGFGGGLLLVLSRSRYEWGNQIDVRNTLQYTWALAFAAACATAALAGPRARRAARVLGGALLLSLVVTTLLDVAGVRRRGPEFWQVLNRDAAVLAAPAAEPPGTLLASNESVLFRIGAHRPVRELEIAGTDRDFVGSLELLARTAAPRPAVLYLVCDDYTKGYSACGGTAEPGVTPPDCIPVRRTSPRVYTCRPRPPA
jgi:hypothetical protein